MLRFCTVVLCGLLAHVAVGQELGTKPSIRGYMSWLTGHDPDTKQLIPADHNALIVEDSVVVAHVKFIVKQYGEVSFPINTKSPLEAEALKADLSESRFVVITYRANQNVILQLRQTGVHGGRHNHVTLAPTISFKTIIIYFSEFKDGPAPLNLSDVAKFNFAFLSNNDKDGYAELVVKDFQIDGYQP
jgi:hypothetical protein